MASWVGPNGFRAVCLSRLHVPDFTVIGLSFPQGKDGAPGPKVQTLFPTGTGRGVELSPRGPRAGRVAQALAVGVALALWDPGQVPVLGHGRPPCLGPHCCVHDPPTGGPRSHEGPAPWEDRGAYLGTAEHVRGGVTREAARREEGVPVALQSGLEARRGPEDEMRPGVGT